MGAGGLALGMWRSRLQRGKHLGDVDGAREQLAAMPRRWFRKNAPRANRACYRSKTDALNKFREWNQGVIDDYGGESYRQSPQEFDAINRKYGLEGNVRVRSIAEALWVAMPPEPAKRGRSDEFCLSSIDVDALNDTSPGRDHAVGFQLPDYLHDESFEARQAAHYRRRRSSATLPVLDPDPVPF